MAFEPNSISSNVGAAPAGAGTVYIPFFYNPAGNGRITVLDASVTLFPDGTATLNIVDLGVGGTLGMVNGGTLWTLGSGGTETVFGAGTPMVGTAVSAIIPAGHWVGIKSEAGTASTATIVTMNYVKGVAP